MIGALSYASLAELLGPRNAILSMLIVPALLFISYCLIMKRHPDGFEGYEESEVLINSDKDPLAPELTLLLMLKLIKPLLKYMIPLFSVYLAEYWINQGLMELLTYGQCAGIKSSAQYRWFQSVYQIGVFISRSSVNFLPIKHIWVLSVLQWVNFLFLFLVARFQFIPGTRWGIAIIFIMILYEGLLGGATYVNAFYRIAKEITPRYKEFCMGIASCGDSTGISIAGGVSIPVHSYISVRNSRWAETNLLVL
eukprot:m.239217 g.239217  ORF g.239217 m.239217 type:complete len:252 (+) comp40177_c0_seq2:1215-1970(+)